MIQLDQQPRMRGPLYAYVLVWVLAFIIMTLPCMSNRVGRRHNVQVRPVILRLDDGQEYASSLSDPMSGDYLRFEKARLHVYGRHFLSHSVICADGVPVTTKYVSVNQLTADAGEVLDHFHYRGAAPPVSGDRELYVNVTVGNPGKKPLLSRAKVYFHMFEGGAG